MTRNSYYCGKTFDTEYLQQMMEPQKKLLRIRLNSRKVVFTIVEGEFSDVRKKLTSGIAGKHKRGGQSADRFTRKRREEVNAFLRKVYSEAKKFRIRTWQLEGEKHVVKRFKRINRIDEDLIVGGMSDEAD